MSEQKKPARKKLHLGGILIYILFLVLCGFGGYFGGEAIDRITGGDDKLAMLYFGVAFLGLIIAVVVQIILHEGGHLLFGLMSRYKFVSFNVMGFICQKDENGKIKAGRMQIAGAGGQCLMAPPAYNDGDFPFTLYNLGGVLANLITAAIFALLAWLIPVLWLRILLVMQVIIGVFFACTNGLPIPVASIQNDGKNLLCIRKDKPARRAFWLQMSIAAELAKGLRLKDMPDDWFAPQPEASMDNAIVSTISVLTTNRLMDQQNFDDAEKEIRALLGRKDGILGLHRMIMSCDGAVCELLAGRPADLTEALSLRENQQLMKAMKTNPSILRTWYAVALLKEQDAAQAEKLLAAFEEASKKYPNPQEIVGERELLETIRAAAAKETEA